jgi:hypothetical protein
MHSSSATELNRSLSLRLLAPSAEISPQRYQNPIPPSLMIRMTKESSTTEDDTEVGYM